MRSLRLLLGVPVAAGLLCAGVWRASGSRTLAAATDGRAESLEPSTAASTVEPHGGVGVRGVAPANGTKAAPPATLQVARRTRREVEALLVEIELRARERGGLLPEDVAEGLGAIDELTPLLGRQQVQSREREFGRRMAVLTRELHIVPLQAELTEMAARVERERDRDARARLVADYRERASELPAIEAAAALARLEGAVGPSARSH